MEPNDNMNTDMFDAVYEILLKRWAGMVNKLPGGLKVCFSPRG